MKLNSAMSFAVLSLGMIGFACAQNATEIVITGRKAANSESEVRSKTISYADLDLSKSAGVTSLLQRIRGAADDVCAPRPMVTDLHGNSDYRKCRSSAIDTAVAKVNNPGLKALLASAGP